MENGQQLTEVRYAAVMAASITGLREGTGNNEPAKLAEFLHLCYEAVDSVMRLYGWVMNPFAGEQLSAFTLLPDHDETLLSQSVGTVLEIRSRIEGMIGEQELPEAAGFSAALAAGEAVLMSTGNGKSRQATLIGNPVDLAIRIQDLADPWQILVDEETFRFSNSHFDYQPLEPVRLKGQNKPVALFELKGKKRERKADAGEAVRMISSDMIGRKQELKIIEELIKQLLNGRGGVLNIEGVAGIGKSRLIAEVMGLDIMRNVLFFEGRALSEGKNLSFHPIIRIIKSWSGITDEDNLSVSGIKLARAIHQVCPDQETEILPFIATMMGYPIEGRARQRISGIEGEAMEKLILKNIRDLLARISDQYPVVIMVEDAHWSDLSSISFMESLFKLVKNHRLLFINVFRPGYKETGDHLKEFAEENLPDHSRAISLTPLGEIDSLELISNLMNRTSLPDEITELIISRSEGNPFFIEEVIRSFIDDGLVEINEKGFTVTDRIRYANIPETIDKVILSRIDRLDEKTKNLLKTASVIGRNFYYKILEEATQTIRELDSRLAYLTEAQLLSEHKTREDVEFLFKHALAQQATYDSILQKTRKNLHLKIAHSIEKVFADKLHEYYGILAMHYGKAEVMDKKEEYLIKAGDEAFKSGASTEALSFYSEALSIMANNPKGEEWHDKYKTLEIKVGFAQEAAGNNIEAIESFQRILDRYYGFSFPASEFKNKYRGLISLLGITFKMHFSSLYFRKNPDEKFDTFMKVVTQWAEAMTSMNPRLLFLQMAYFMNRIIRYNLSGSVPGLSFFIEATSLFMWTGISFRVSRKMIDYAKNAGAENNPSSLIDYRFIKRMYDFHVGNLEEEKDFEEVYRTGMHIGDFWPTTIYTLYSGMAAIAKGNYPAVKTYIRKLEDISESFDNSHARAQSYRLSALAHSLLGMYDQAITIADEGIRYTGKTGHFAMLLVIWCAKSMAHTAENETEEAMKALREAEKLVAERKIMTIYHMPFLQAKARLEFSLLKNAIERKQPAGEHLAAIKLTVDKLIRLSAKMKSSMAEAYRIKAMVYWMLRRQQKAYKYFRLSIRAGQKYNSTLELSRTYFEAGKCLREPGSVRSSLLGVNGSEYLLKAKMLFLQMDLRQDLQKYEQYIEA